MYFQILRDDSDFMKEFPECTERSVFEVTVKERNGRGTDEMVNV